MPLQRMALLVWAVGASGLETGALTPADIDGPHPIGVQPPSEAARGLDHVLAALEAELTSFDSILGTSVLGAERERRPAWLTKFLAWLGGITSRRTTPQDAMANPPANACPDITDKCEKLGPVGANDAASAALVKVAAGGEGQIYKVALLPDEDANDGAENRQQKAQRVGQREEDGGLNSDYDFTRDVERVAGYTGRNFLAYKTLFETIMARALIITPPDLLPAALPSWARASQGGADDWRRVQTDFVVASTLKTASGQDAPSGHPNIIHMYGFGINNAAWSKDLPDVAYLLEWLEVPSIDSKEFVGVYHDTEQGVWEEIEDYDDQTKVRPSPRRAPSRPRMAGMRRFARAGHLHAAGDRAGRHPDGRGRRTQVHARQQVRLSPQPHTHPPPLPPRARTRSWIHWDIKPGNIGAAQLSEFKKRTLPRNGGVRSITPREAPRPVVRAHISPGHHCRTVPQWFTISGCPCNSRARKR